MDDLRRTPLFDRHASLDARFVPFAGWQLPVQFSSIVDEHRAVRTASGVFDVSHMGRFEVEGDGALDRLQEILSNDLDRISAGEAQYTLLLNDAGGVVDDLIAYRRGDSSFLIVGNAGNRDVDHALLPGAGDISDSTAMIAVQGPDALRLLDLELDRFTWREARVLDVDCIAAGTGYTGEEGCELICSADDVAGLWDAVLAQGVVPCGLGARDTLRLEVCYPLHGQDITAERDPYSAGLGWAVATDKSFTGSDVLASIRESGPRERLVAFVMRDKGLPRAGMSLVGGGVVTSGAYSPMLELGIGMAYVASELAEEGTELTVDIRGRERRAVVVQKPIYRPGEE